MINSIIKSSEKRFAASILKIRYVSVFFCTMEAEQKLHSPPTSPTKSLNSPRQTADTSPRQTAEVSPKIPSELMKQLSKELEKKGYFIVNNCLGDSYCKLLRGTLFGL